MQKNDGGPAFPQVWQVEMGVDPSTVPAGMSLRDWLAGTSDAVLVDKISFEAAATFVGLKIGDRAEDELPAGYSCWAEAWAAIQARLLYIKADAMLKERQKGDE